MILMSAKYATFITRGFFVLYSMMTKRKTRTHVSFSKRKIGTELDGNVLVMSENNQTLENAQESPAIISLNEEQENELKQASHLTDDDLDQNYFAPQRFTIKEWSAINEAAKRIQYFYFRRKYNEYCLETAALNPSQLLLTDELGNTDRYAIEHQQCLLEIGATVDTIDDDSHKPILVDEECQQLDDPNELIQNDKTRHSLLIAADAEIEIPWVQPSLIVAKKFEADTHPRKAGKKSRNYNWRRDSLGRHCTFGGCGEQLDLWDEGVMSEFSQFGSGVTNYFKFLKWSCWVMFILSILHIPAVTINMFGRSMHYASNNALARTTLGNLGAQNVTNVAIPGCDSKNYNFVGACAFEKDHIAFFYAVLDAAGTIIVIIAWIWLRFFEQNEVNNLNRSTVDASDYTLRVQNIPPRSTEREVSIHFAGITGEEVADVNLAFANADEIRDYMKRGQLIQERYNCVQRIRYQKALTNDNNHRLRRLLKERDRLTTIIEEKDRLRQHKIKIQPDAIEAFVTFETEEGFVKAMSAYQLSLCRTLPCIYPKHLTLNGYRFRVMQAPEPSTIIWENFEVKRYDRVFRKCITTGVALLAIFFSILFTFRAREFKLQTIDSISARCPDNFTSLSSSLQYTLVKTNQQLASCYCSALPTMQQWKEPLCRGYVKRILKSSSMNYATGFMVCFMNILFTIIMDKAGSFEGHESMDSMEKNIMTRVFFLKFINTGCLVLLFNQRWLQAIVGVRFPDPRSFNLDWYETGGVSLIIVMSINMITPHIPPLLAYRSHRTKLKRLEQSLANMSGVVDDLSKRIWYSQDDLNAQFLGPTFQLNYRYSQILVTFYICWMYAISMPILPLIGAASFFVSYWVEKFLFCNFYRTPPKYSNDMGQRSTQLVGLCILVHLTLSCWTLGNGEIFSGRFIGKRKVTDEVYDFLYKVKIRNILFKRHIVILELVSLCFLGGLLFYSTTSRFRMAVKRIWMCLVCSPGDKVGKLRAVMNTVQIKYSNAYNQGIIKGVTSYNILKNPKYQNAFAISSEFASAHRRLSAIRGFNTKEGSDNTKSSVIEYERNIDTESYANADVQC